ncbi:MAG: hypothetical protein IIX23_00005, partial [Oscillospiraceae bacterium]|nr:hypothetical protein [Oscillospiraceae bacterium]
GRADTDGEALQLSNGGIRKTSGNPNQVAGSKKNFILFHCPLDGEQFITHIGVLVILNKI